MNRRIRGGVALCPGVGGDAAGEGVGAVLGAEEAVPLGMGEEGREDGGKGRRAWGFMEGHLVGAGPLLEFEVGALSGGAADVPDEHDDGGGDDEGEGREGVEGVGVGEGGHARGIVTGKGGEEMW